MSYLRQIKKFWRNEASFPSVQKGPPVPAKQMNKDYERPAPIPLVAQPVNPYRNLPKHVFWSRSHRVKLPSEIDPVLEGGFKISKKHRIATAGSCFAQHIARHLQENGYTYHITEKVHPVICEEVARDFGYGVFSARYGNIYTARQLLQLMQRAYGEFQPVEDAWEAKGGFLDPFRPNIQPTPFATLDEFYQQRDIHFAAVREMFETTDVFVFTFGLTEAWMHKQDGAVFPLAPGVHGGSFDPQHHVFKNFSVDEISNDFKKIVARMREINPTVKVLMTVSPVPLIATARDDQSVITATSYSKAVLRVAAEELASSLEDCFYFPSYEVITGNYTRGAYYAEDLREVRREGVDHVMDLFMRHYTRRDLDSGEAQRRVTALSNSDGRSIDGGEPNSDDAIERALDVICEEALIERVTG